MTFKIPLFKVLMAAQAKDMVAEVLASGHVAQGPLVDEFEKRLAEQFEVPAEHIVTVNSGTSALHLAYHLADIVRNDVVIATPMTCSATIAPLVHLGAGIVWADIESHGGNILPDSVFKLLDINRHVQAIVTVDWGGTPAEYENIRSVVPKSIPIIEDAAHAYGARRRDGRTIATAALDDNIFVCYSFQAIKHLTTGDGGALVCPTRELADRARLLRWFGLDRRSSKDFRCQQQIVEAGYKFHMNDIAAAIGLANMNLANNARWQQRQHAERYYEAFSGPPYTARLAVPPLHPGGAHWLYTILVEDRDSFQRYMTEQGIETSQVHRRNDEHPAFPGRSPVSLSGLDYFSKHQVSIPVGWWLTDPEVEYIINAVKAWASV